LGSAPFALIRLEFLAWLPMREETVASNGRGVRERRRHERYTVYGEAEVMVADGKLLFRGSIMDISLSGCFIETRARLRLTPGTPVQMVFRADRLTLRMTATVRAMRPGAGAGFLFETMSTTMQTRLESLIAEMQERARASVG
jgi:PilZ domain